MSAWEELELEIRQLPVSRPIFQLFVDHNGWSSYRVVLVPDNKVKPRHLVSREELASNPLKALAVMHHEEYFDTDKRTWYVAVDAIKVRVISEIRNWVKGFLYNHTKNIDNETMLSWYNFYALNHSTLETVYFEPLLNLYKYVHSNMLNEDAAKHETNALAILDLMFQRDYKENHLPQRRRRRRRRK